MFLRETLVALLVFVLAFASPAPTRTSAQRGRAGQPPSHERQGLHRRRARHAWPRPSPSTATRIVAVGTTREIQSRFRGARTIDLSGRLVTPGFNDAHIHFLGGGLALLRVELNGAKTLAEAKRRVAARVRAARPGAWILGRGWDHTLWGGEWPTKKDLDEVAPANPVFLQRVDGHVSWANTLALAKADVTRETQAPAGRRNPARRRGRADRHSEGDGRRDSSCASSPRPRDEQNTEALERALAEARRYGITSIQDNSGYAPRALYRELLKQGRLTVRVSEWQDFERHGRGAEAPARGVRLVQRRPAPSATRRAQRLRGRHARLAHRRHARALRRRPLEQRHPAPPAGRVDAHDRRARRRWVSDRAPLPSATAQTAWRSTASRRQRETLARVCRARALRPSMCDSLRPARLAAYAPAAPPRRARAGRRAH